MLSGISTPTNEIANWKKPTGASAKLTSKYLVDLKQAWNVEQRDIPGKGPRGQAASARKINKDEPRDQVSDGDIAAFYKLLLTISRRYPHESSDSQLRMCAIGLMRWLIEREPKNTFSVLQLHMRELTNWASDVRESDLSDLFSLKALRDAIRRAKENGKIPTKSALSRKDAGKKYLYIFVWEKDEPFIRNYYYLVRSAIFEKAMFKAAAQEQSAAQEYSPTQEHSPVQEYLSAEEYFSAEEQTPAQEHSSAQEHSQIEEHSTAREASARPQSVLGHHGNRQRTPLPKRSEIRPQHHDDDEDSIFVPDDEDPGDDDDDDDDEDDTGPLVRKRKRSKNEVVSEGCPHRRFFRACKVCARRYRMGARA